jgi:general secretion pathway protein H
MKNSRESGFTLIELMLVIFIIGLLVSMVRLPALSSSPFELVDQESKKLGVLINMASDRAILKNRQIGLALNEQQYVFLEFIENKWQVISEPPFITEPLPTNVTVQLNLDDLPWSEENLLSAVKLIDEEELEKSSQKSAEERALEFPQIFILSSGEISSFEIEMTYDDFDQEITFLVQGEFSAPVHVYDPLQIEELDR